MIMSKLVQYLSEHSVSTSFWKQLSIALNNNEYSTIEKSAYIQGVIDTRIIKDPNEVHLATFPLDVIMCATSTVNVKQNIVVGDDDGRRRKTKKRTHATYSETTASSDTDTDISCM